MINQLIGFFSSERRLLNRWQLPLTGLILMGGLAATATTLKGTAPHQPKQAVHPASVAPPFLSAVESQQQNQAVKSTSVAASPVTVASQSPDRTLIAAVIAQPSTTAPESATQAVASTSTTDSLANTSKPTAQVLDSTAVASTSVSQKPSKALGSTGVATPSAKWNRHAQASGKTTVADASMAGAPIPDGIYLYGQSSEPQQVGKEYLVFEAHQGKVTGALYLPNSEYSCFHGVLDAKQLNLTVTNPYDQTAFSHTIARAQPAKVAAAGGQINLENTYDSLTYPYTVQLEGYQPVTKISDSDRQLLNECRNPSQGQTRMGNE